MVLKNFLEIFLDIYFWLFNCLILAINSDIFKTIIGVFVGGLLSSIISKNQVRDNNNFVVLIQIKDEIMQNVDKSHNNVNDFITVLNNMSKTLFNTKNQKNELEKRFIMLNLLTELTNITNSSRSCNNYIVSNIELLKSIYSENDEYILSFEKEFLISSINCIEFLYTKSQNVVDILSERGKNEISIDVLIDKIGAIMKEISENELVSKFMMANAAYIIEFINTEISILISKRSMFEFDKIKVKKQSK